jgi:hypothetical protein
MPGGTACCRQVFLTGDCRGCGGWILAMERLGCLLRTPTDCRVYLVVRGIYTTEESARLPLSLGLRKASKPIQSTSKIHGAVASLKAALQLQC